MAKTLFVFLFSDRVDTYINAIAYTYDKMQVDSVRLVYVRGAKTGLADSQAITISNQIWNRLEDFAAKGIGTYKRLNERLLDRQLVPIDYSVLKEDLKRLIKRHSGSRNCIVDLTGASKVPSIEVFSVCLALGIRSVYIFELASRPNLDDPEGSLYHSLSEEEYSYTCLSNAEPVKTSQSALLRKSSLLWYVVAISLVVMVISLYIFVAIGPDSMVVQGLNLAAAVVGLISPFLALLEQRR